MNIKNIKVICVIIILFLFIMYFVNKEKDEIVYIDSNGVNESIDYNNIEDDEIIKVYISGEVVKPDIYEVKVGSRIIDVIELAGGTTDEGDIKNINLVEYVSDAQHILIPSIKVNTVVDIEIDEVTNKINLNTATKNELMTINGIGEVTAGKIIEYREENGDFIYISDLKNIKGIGDKTFEKLKDNFFIN